MPVSMCACAVSPQEESCHMTFAMSVHLLMNEKALASLLAKLLAKLQNFIRLCWFPHQCPPILPPDLRYHIAGVVIPHPIPHAHLNLGLSYSS